MELKPSLPEDLLVHILPHLPLKSLVRCKTLSCHWNTQISHSRLVETHQERHPEPNSTLLLRSERGSDLTILPRHNGYMDSICRAKSQYLSRDLTNSRIVVGAHNGVICFSDYETGDARVWNPLTKQWKSFGCFRPYCPSITFFGFGFDTVNGDYKVVRIIESHIYDLVFIEIYMLNNTRYREIGMLPGEVQFMLSKTTPITVNGSSHWIAFHSTNKNLQIVRFDMDREKFVNIPFSEEMPNISYDTRVRRIEDLNLRGPALHGFVIDGKQFRLGVFKGSLCMFISDLLKAEIWLMNEEDRHVVWTRMFEIPISRMVEEVVGFTANEELVIRNANNDYFAYDPWKNIYVFPLELNGFIHQTIAYVESLVPLLPH